MLSGIAPDAYLGNYKALGVPSQFGANGNSPELAAAIEAAVRDGMDVINLSLGESEIEPKRDVVAKAINAAADAGVVASVSAGNDFARVRIRLDHVAGERRQGDHRRGVERRSRQPGRRPHRGLLLRRTDAVLPHLQAGRHRPRRRRVSLPRPAAATSRTAGRACRRRTWQERPPCSASAIPRGPPPRSSRRSSRPATRCTTAAPSRSIRSAKAEAGSIFRARTSRSCSSSRPRSRSGCSGPERGRHATSHCRMRAVARERGV